MESVEEALARYHAAFERASTGRMTYTGVSLRIVGGAEYVAAFEDLQAARAREGRPWRPGESRRS